MKTLLISQLTRNIDKKNEDFQKMRSEYTKLKTFFRLTKKYVEEKSIQFTDNLEVLAFHKLIFYHFYIYSFIFRAKHLFESSKNYQSPLIGLLLHLAKKAYQNRPKTTALYLRTTPETLND